MKISLCVTVLNEEKSIERLINSILTQSILPYEFVLVDGGSVDSTVSIITNYTSYFKNKKIKFKFIKSNNIGIAQGRNLAIKNATGNIIVHTDAGCVAKPNWIKKITQPFINSNTDVVAGFYEMPYKNHLQEAMSVFHGVPPQRYNPNTFVPSARSLAFKKSVWKRIGGFNEKLKNAGEDSLFFYEIVKRKFNIERVGEAKVVWEETKNMSFTKFVSKSFNYAKGDIQTKIWINLNRLNMSHNIKVVLIFFRYLIALLMAFMWFKYGIDFMLNLLIILMLIYFIYPILKWYDVIKNTKSRLWLTVVQICSDLAVMCGFVSGIIYSDD